MLLVVSFQRVVPIIMGLQFESSVKELLMWKSVWITITIVSGSVNSSQALQNNKIAYEARQQCITSYYVRFSEDDGYSNEQYSSRLPACTPYLEHAPKKQKLNTKSWGHIRSELNKSMQTDGK